MTNPPRLGSIRYVVNTDNSGFPSITKTAIHSVSLNHFETFSGHQEGVSPMDEAVGDMLDVMMEVTGAEKRNAKPHTKPRRIFDSLSEACRTAQKILAGFGANSQWNPAMLRALSAQFDDPKFLESIESTPIISRGNFIFDVEEKEARLPDTTFAYHQPGTMIWFPVTPDTHNMMSPHHRPAKYFVIGNVPVKSVTLRPDGSLYYNLNTHFSPQDKHLFTNQADALAELMKIIEAEVPRDPSKVYIWTGAEEKVRDKADSDAIGKMVMQSMKHG